MFYNCLKVLYYKRVTEINTHFDHAPNIWVNFGVNTYSGIVLIIFMSCFVSIVKN